MSDDRYARVKFSIMDDPKFDGIRENPALLGSWTLCLVVAEMAWPSPAFVPPWITRAAFQRLVAAELIDLLPNGSYRIHGLDAERSRRSDQARTASKARWTADSNADSKAASSAGAALTVMPSKAEQSREEQQQDLRADLHAFYTVKFHDPTPAQRSLMDAYCRVFDETGPERAAALIYRNPADPIGAIKADLEKFRDERRREAEAQERPVVKRARKGTGMSPINVELAKMLGDQYASQEAHVRGAHVDAPEADCPACRESGVPA